MFDFKNNDESNLCLCVIILCSVKKIQKMNGEKKLTLNSLHINIFKLQYSGECNLRVKIRWFMVTFGTFFFLYVYLFFRIKFIFVGLL